MMDSRKQIVILGAGFGGIHWSGIVAWLLWRSVYLMNFASWAKRVRIAIDWTLNLTRSRDITLM